LKSQAFLFKDTKPLFFLHVAQQLYIHHKQKQPLRAMNHHLRRGYFLLYIRGAWDALRISTLYQKYTPIPPPPQAVFTTLKVLIPSVITASGG
jgi:hypothetical protein